ncbi:hypothetical protein CWB41_13585 [Methylovirgula ligni]|uniref:Uncharacterized protein n=1 Tax=Methylovirgula ligni TaxID=569860 RepID=A0A3D9YWN9_9HYPH|nr:hypothetical protein [Methylovirgula ligni]QAY96633.1 hypothetical protein CWB41_13585 [Methylovirgula ligni]REF83329.1 hypothetical protein DES32_3249 [Methylovirgula ligni]
MTDISAPGSAIEKAISTERQRCIERVLAYAALRDQAAISLDKAALDPDGDDKPSEGASERARMQADVARDIARFLSEEAAP